MKRLINEVADILNLDKKIVEAVVDSYTKTLGKVFRLQSYNKLESFEGVKTNIIIPGLGKLVVTDRRKTYFKYKQKEKKDGRG